MGEFILLIEHDRRTNEVVVGIMDTIREYDKWEEIPKDTLKALKDATSILSVYFTQLLEENDDE
jgi:hypothetical protein